MRAIQVKVLPATNTKPVRYKAFSENLSVIVSATNAPGDSNASNYMYAAIQFMIKYNWRGELLGGYTNEGMAFVFKNNLYQIERQ